LKIEKHSLLQMEAGTQANGRETSGMAMEIKIFQTVIIMKDNIRVISHQVKVNLSMLMVTCMKATGWKAKHMGLVYSLQLMVRSTKGIGSMTNITVLEKKFGLMDLNMKATTTRVQSMEMESTYGLTERSMKENGR